MANSISKMRQAVLAFFLLSAVASHSYATNWVESVNGDLSSSNLAPTPITFTPGVNRVSGTMGADPGDGIPLDRDFFTITLAPNQVITSINVIAFSPPGASFYAIGPGTSINITSSATHLSNILVQGPGEILPTLAAGAYNGGTGLSNPIGPGGTYTIWFQELASVVTYDIAYTVSTVNPPTPVPALPFGMLGIFGMGVVIFATAIWRLRND